MMHLYRLGERQNQSLAAAARMRGGPAMGNQDAPIEGKDRRPFSALDRHAEVFMGTLSRSSARPAVSESRLPTGLGPDGPPTLWADFLDCAAPLTCCSSPARRRGRRLFPTLTNR